MKGMEGANPVRRAQEQGFYRPPSTASQVAEEGRNDMDIQWRHDPDAALEEAKRKRQPVLIDFTAAPM
jgi:hypothetical protein